MSVINNPSMPQQFWAARALFGATFAWVSSLSRSITLAVRSKPCPLGVGQLHIAGLHPALAQMTCVKSQLMVFSATSLCPNLQFLLVFTGAVPMVLTITLNGVPVTETLLWVSHCSIFRRAADAHNCSCWCSDSQRLV